MFQVNAFVNYQKTNLSRTLNASKSPAISFGSQNINIEERLENAIKEFLLLAAIKKEDLNAKPFDIVFLDNTMGKAAIDYNPDDNKLTIAVVHLNSDGWANTKKEITSISLLLPQAEKLHSAGEIFKNYLTSSEAALVNGKGQRTPSNEEILSILESLTRSVHINGPVITDKRGTYLLA